MSQGQLWNAGTVKTYITKRWPTFRPLRPCENENCNETHRRRRFCSTQCAESARPRSYATPERRNKNHTRRTLTRYTDATPQDIQNLLANRTYCPLCNKRMTDGQGKRQKTIDHIIPINMGGTHTLGNLRTICFSCNSGRPRDGSDLINHQPNIWATDQDAAAAAASLRPPRLPRRQRAQIYKVRTQARRLLRQSEANVAYLHRLNGATWDEIVERFNFSGAGHAHNVVYGGDGRAYAPARDLHFKPSDGQ